MVDHPQKQVILSETKLIINRLLLEKIPLERFGNADFGSIKLGTIKILSIISKDIHCNPVHHGLVRSPKDWQFSSFHRYVEAEVYDLMWGLRKG